MNRKKMGTVRIIGGRWRGRRLPVPDLHGLRPSGDRGRETLFNWLAPIIHGARCADLFAGTGALGLEAASRGAASVVLIEKQAAAARALRDNVALLQAGDPRGLITVEQGDGLAWLKACAAASLDIVFLDPPFGSGLDTAALDLLAAADVLAGDGLVYLETARQDPSPGVIEGWETLRDKALGEVRMRLLKKIS
jgi:16S rRNA (guanine966-N2)-methyltransferase